MVLTADYPVLDVLWTTIIFLCWIAWIWLLILSFFDLFARDASGWAGATTRQGFDQLRTRALAWPPSMTEIGGTA